MPDENYDNAIVETRLNAVLDLQRDASRRLTDINGTWVNPGPPNAPRILAAIISEAQTTIATAQAIQRKITGGR